jgi:hypothetical protein
LLYLDYGELVLNNFNPSELEKRLSIEVFAKVEGRERVDITQEMIERFKQDRDQSQIELHKLKETQTRQITLIARIIIVPLSFLFLAYVLLIAHGLLYGEIVGISKFNDYKILLTQAPMMFWFAVFYHSLFLLFIGFSIYRCWQGTEWFNKKNG